MYEYCTSCNDAGRTPTTCNSCCYEIMIAYKDGNPTAYILLCDNPPLLILDVTKTELEFKAKELGLKDFKITGLYK